MTASLTPGEWLCRSATLHPSATALLLGDTVWDYRQLGERVASLQVRLSELGIAPGTTLACRSNNPLLTTLLLHAALRGAITLQPLDPRLPQQLLTEQLQQSGADVMVEDEDEKIDASACRTLSAAQLLQEGNTAAPTLTATPDGHIALIIATSGSSGEPKGVMLSTANLTAAVFASHERLPLNPGDRWLACLPLFHIGGLSILLRAAQAAATVVLQPRFDAPAVWQQLQNGVTHLSLVPAMLARLLEEAADTPPPTSLRVVLIGGAALSPALRQRALSLGWPLCISYGMSETASQVATRCLRGDDVRESVGLPLNGITLQLLDSEGNPGASEGRIRLRGPMVMAGYANPEQQPGDGLDGGWFTTGDICRLNDKGELLVLGRADEVLVSGGENIQPQQVEALLAPFPGLTEAGVTGLTDPVWGEVVTAVVAGEFELEALEAWCAEQLAGPHKPRAFIKIEELPRTANGKLDRRALHEVARAAQTSTK